MKVTSLNPLLGAGKLLVYFKSLAMLVKLFRMLIWVQGLYTLLTALWALFHIDSFMVITGPKTDIWLVKTVSVLLVAIAASLLSFLAVQSHPLPAIVLGALTAIGLAAIDIYYTSIDRIKWIYLLDAIPELVFFTAWLLLLVKRDAVHQQIKAF